MAIQERDMRIDAVRGLALWVIYTDHVRWNAFGEFTLRRLGFCDAADVFVFLSGYVCGIAYYKLLVRRGFIACQAKALWRCGQLYAGYVITVLVTLGLLAVLDGWHPDASSAARLAGARELIAHPTAVILGTLSSTYALPGFTILPLYMLLLALLPGVLALFRVNRLAMVGAVVAIYTIAQVYPRTEFESRWLPTLSGFRPIAWQLLFFVGAALGAEGREGRVRIPRHPLLLFLAAAGVEAAFLLVTMRPIWPIPWTGKANLEPLRLLHFFLLAYLASALLPRSAAVWRHWATRPVVVCGQNSLAVYCFGTVLAAIGTAVLAVYGYGLGLEAGVNVGGWLACFLFALLWQQLRRAAGGLAEGLLAGSSRPRAAPVAPTAGRTHASAPP